MKNYCGCEAVASNQVLLSVRTTSNKEKEDNSEGENTEEDSG